MGASISIADAVVAPLGKGYKCRHWALVSLVAVLSGAPWIPRRFNLRTLLIGMTVAALWLGLAVYAFK